ncbi:methyltransferase type 11 [Sulfolobus sp. E5-1-F]|uniref:methyltransferase type 11 n=1 Tax=Saccharolobus sp. E5-1-F TaxID=2663019 RepID=UPI001295220D|nr:methyltransferase type 11 [Sulfolobus sp. E5-1-F]QGA54565.1 methyltransferase type 11 [Sulfolobus sp. E5-1-F]
MSFASRYVYYSVFFLGLIILLAVFANINYFYQSPSPPSASGNIHYNITSYNISLSLDNIIKYAKIQHFKVLSNLTKDSLGPIVNQTGNMNIIDSLKKILELNATLVSPVRYWEAEDLIQFLNASFFSYRIMHSYTIPLSDKENETWTQNYLTFNISKFNVTIYNNTYTPSTNVTAHLSIINSTIVVLKPTEYNIWPSGTFNEIGFYDVYGESYRITYSYPYISGNYLVFVPAQTASSGLIYFTKYLYIQGGISIALEGGATESNTPSIADGFYIGIAYGYVTSWAFNIYSIQKTIYGSGFPYSGSVAFPANTYAIVVQFDPLGPNVNFFISNGNVRYQISYVGLGISYRIGQLLYFNVTLQNGIITAYVANVNTGQYVKLSVALSNFDWYPTLQNGLYTIYLGGATGTGDGNWYINYASMRYYIPNFMEISYVNLQGEGYTYNGTNPLTWLQNNTYYKLLRYGDGPYQFSLTYTMFANQSYKEYVKVFANDTLIMDMHYGNIIIKRNYTGLVGWINATPAIVQNQYGGYNYTLKFSINITTFPVPDYVVIHPPPSEVFKNNYAFEYLEWTEYRLLAENIYNFTIQFTDNVTAHLNYNYTKFWKAEAYGITAELIAHNIRNISSSYQHQYPIEALWDENGTQYEANINLALILENLMPVNVTIGNYYNVTSFYPIAGHWINNWSYVYVNVQDLPEYWLNNTVFLQYNYTYLSDIASLYKYFSYWQIPNGTYNNVTLYSPLPTTIIFHYGTYYLNITPIIFYNTTTTLKLSYNDTAEYKFY